MCRRRRGVERRDADQAVHAGLALQVAVGVLAAHLDGGRLDARFLAREQVDDLGLEARPLRPAQVHAHEHLGPVLRLGAARARVDGEDRVLPVLGPREDDLQLEGFELLAPALQALLDLGGHALVARLGGHLPEQAASPRRWPASSLKVPTVRASSARSWTSGLRLAGVVPEAAAWPSRRRCRPRRVSLAGRSKMPPEIVQALVQLGESRFSSPSMRVSTSGRVRMPSARAPETAATAVGQPVAEARVQRRRASRSGTRWCEHAALESGSVRADPAGGLDERRDAGVRRARDRPRDARPRGAAACPGAARGRSSRRTTRRW